MPNRIIKESARTSETLDRLSAEAERMFWRLITVADDHGRFEADSRILLANCFPLKVASLKVTTVEKWLDELVSVHSVTIYSVKGKKYGAFSSWEAHQRKRAEHSKYPSPDDSDRRTSADIGGEMPQASSSNNSPNGRTEIEQKDENGDSRTSADIGGHRRRNASESSIREARVDNEKREAVTALTPETFISLYHVAKPDECRKVKFLTLYRRKKYIAYLKQFPDPQFWDHVFEEMHLSPFLRGKVAQPGRRPFHASLDWLCEAKDGVENCIKVHEGNYRPENNPTEDAPDTMYDWQTDTSNNPLSHDPS